MDTAPDDSIWADGCLTTSEAMAFLQRSRRMFVDDAKRNKWPRRYRGRGALWPKKILMMYLAGLPTTRGKQGASS